MGMGSAYNFNRNHYQQTFLQQQQQRGSGMTNTTNMRMNNNPKNVTSNRIQSTQQLPIGPQHRPTPTSIPTLNHVGTAQLARQHHNITSSAGAAERPYMMFVYSQKFTVAGQGEYEIKITNVINPYTMKATPLQPSLIDPAYMMANGIGNTKKSLAITSDQLPQLIMQQNRIREGTGGLKGKRGARQRSSDSRERHRHSTNNLLRDSGGDHLKNRLGNQSGRNKFLSGGAQVRMLACSGLYKKAAQTVGINKNKNVQSGKNYAALKQHSEEEMRRKRMELGAKLFKKLINQKLRNNLREIKTKSWQVYKYREQQKKKRGMQLFKFMVLIQDKQKNHKFFAMSKLKENHLSQIQEKSSNGGQDSKNTSNSQQNSKSNSQSQYYLKSLNPQDNNYISPTPTTAAQSFQAPKVTHEKQKAIKVITYYMERMIKDNQFAFWLPFRAHQKKTNAYVKELKIDFGSKQFNRDQLEQELAKRFNKIEIKRVDSKQEQSPDYQQQQNPRLSVGTDNNDMNYQNFMKNQQLYEIDETLDFGDTSKIMDVNFANVSSIQPQMFHQYSRMEDTFIQELQQLNSQRSRVNSRLSIDQQQIQQQSKKKNTAEIQNFKPILDPFALNNDSPLKQKHSDHDHHNILDASSFIVMEDDVKAIKIENNLANLNKDIMQVNDEIEQIKKLLFTAQNDEEEEDDNLFEFEPQSSTNMQKKQLAYPYENSSPNFINKNYNQQQQQQQQWNEDSFIDNDYCDNDYDYQNSQMMNNSQIIESHTKPLITTKKRQLVPVNRINNKFRTEEEMIQYYELKALDHIDERYNQDNKNNNLDEFEEAKYEEEIEHLISGKIKKQSSYVPAVGRRDRADSIKKNIQKYEKTRRKNLNDSRENDFDGFDEDDFIGNSGEPM